MTMKKDLNTTIGRLMHVSMIIPFVHHFLGQLCKILLWSKWQSQCTTHIMTICLNNLWLMNDWFLVRACNWINMNQIAFRHPTHVFRWDSGPGGYNNGGFAWRFPIDDALKFSTSNNPLKHLASIISPWVDIVAGQLKHGDCLLSMTNSTTSEGWTRRTRQQWHPNIHPHVICTVTLNLFHGTWH